MTEDGIVQSVCEQPVFGTIKDLRVLPWNESRRSPLPEVVRATLYVPNYTIFCVVPTPTNASKD